MNALQKIRKYQNLTQYDLSNMSGICISHIHQYENTKINLSEASIFKLAAALGVTIKDIKGEGQW